MLCNSTEEVEWLLSHEITSPTQLLKKVQSWTSKDTENKNRRKQFSEMTQHAQNKILEYTHNPRINQVRELPRILNALTQSPYDEKALAELFFLGPILSQSLTKLNPRDCEDSLGTSFTNQTTTKLKTHTDDGYRGAFYTSPFPFHFGMWRHEQESLRVDISLVIPNRQSFEKVLIMLQFLDRLKYTKGCEIFHNKEQSGYSTYIQMSPEELKWINDHPQEHDEIQERHLNNQRTHAEMNGPHKAPEGYLTQTPNWSTRYGPKIAPGDEFTPATKRMYMGFDGAFYRFMERAQLLDLFFQLAL